MEGKQQKLYYLAVLGIAVVSAVLLSTVFEPKKKSAETAEKAPKAQTPPPAGEKGDGELKAAKPAEKKSEPASPPVVKIDPAERARRERAARDRLRQQTIVPLETDAYRATVSNLNAGLTSFKIKGDRYRDQENKPVNMVTTDRESYYPLGVQLTDADSGEPVIGGDAFWEIERKAPGALRLSAKGGGISVQRKLEAGQGPYQLWVTTTVANREGPARRLAHGIGVHHYVERSREMTPVPLLSLPSAEVSNGLCYYTTKAQDIPDPPPAEEVIEREDRETLLQPHSFKGGVHFAGVENVYFLSAVAPHPVAGQPQAQSCRLLSSDRGLTAKGEPLGALFTSELRYPDFELGPGESRTFRVMAYLGPKMPDDLGAAGHGLPKAIDFGFFAILSESLTWLLRTIHSGVGNWGVAIILLTLLVKLVLYPLTAKSFQSMARMRMLKPEMDKINEMYQDDREKKSAATMELYRKHKINPLGGCLPQLLQLPIWIALYTSLRTNVELYHAPFALWWTDLSSPDPFFVLPLVLGALMYVQQKMSPPAADPMQAKMMLYMMPTMITAFMLFLPAGLCLYILTNSVLSIAQQRMIEQRLKEAASSGTASGENGTGADKTAGDSEISSAGRETRTKQSKPGKPQGRSRSVRRKKTA